MKLPFKPGSTMDWDVFVTKVAIYAGQGFGQLKIAEFIKKETGEMVTWKDVKKALADKTCREKLDAFNRHLVSEAQLQAKASTARLVAQAVGVIEAQLKKKNLKAAQMVLEAVGALEKDKDTGQAQSLTVVLPGAKHEEKEIEITSSENTSFADEARFAEDMPARVVKGSSETGEDNG